jgi:hypothetical protein
MRQVHDWVQAAVDSLELDDIGADLAYLLGAILHNSTCAWPESRPFVRLLRRLFRSRKDKVWKHVTVAV